MLISRYLDIKDIGRWVGSEEVKMTSDDRKVDGIGAIYGNRPIRRFRVYRRK